jgi:hypothetical protein
MPSKESSNRMVNGKTVRSVNGKTVRCGFVRLVRSVLYDTSLSLSARCIYGVLADRVGCGRTVRIGQRKIAELLGVHQETVLEGIKELCLHKHIEIARTASQRSIYILLSSTFGKAQGQRDVVVSGPGGGRRYASLDNEKHGLPKVAGASLETKKAVG